MKRLLCLAVSAIMMLSFSACGSNDEAENSTSTAKSTIQSENGEKATAVNENSTEQATNTSQLTTGENATTSANSINADVSGKSNNSTTLKAAQQNNSNKNTNNGNSNNKTTTKKSSSNNSSKSSNTSQKTTTKKSSSGNTAQKTTTKKNTSNKVSHTSPQQEQEMLKMVNAERKKAGVPALTWNEDIYFMAKIRAQEVAEYFRTGGEETHDYDPHYRIYNGERDDFWTVFVEYDYLNFSAVSENISECVVDNFNKNGVSFMMNGLMNSPSHKKAILDSQYKTMSIAFADYKDKEGNTGHVVVQLFYTPN